MVKLFAYIWHNCRKMTCCIIKNDDSDESCYRLSNLSKTGVISVIINFLNCAKLSLLRDYIPEIRTSVNQELQKINITRVLEFIIRSTDTGK